MKLLNAKYPLIFEPVNTFYLKHDFNILFI